MASPESTVERHYSREGLTDRILAALRNAGADTGSLSYRDLWPFDQFHTRGRDATVELAQLAGLQPGMRVLDVGSGIGGPARLLAAEFACRVTGIDLTEEFCNTAGRLSEIVGLRDRVEFRCANALDLPFDPETFDAVWTQHTSMNIADKKRLYAEMYRVLKPGGRVAIHDVVAGRVAPIHFPVPWARDASISSLITAEDMRQKLEYAGLKTIVWQDTTVEARTWFQARAKDLAGSASPRVGLHLLQGADWPVMIGNVARNLVEDRAAVVEVVLEKPAR